MTANAATADSYADLGRKMGHRLAPVAFVMAAGVGVLAWRIASGGHPMLALLLPLLVLLPMLPVLLWMRPQVGVFVIFLSAVLIEQFDYEVGPRRGAVTARIPFFHSITPGLGITVFEVLLGLLIFVLVLKRIGERRAFIPRTALARRLALLLGIVLFYLVLGLLRHGDSKIALWEVRPYFYVAILYLLASILLTSVQAIRVLMWSIVIGAGLKAVYGIVIWSSIRHLNPRPEAVLGHEESFFFAVFVFLVLGLWLLGLPGALRTTGTALLPIVLLADMCNSRRTAWGVLITGAIFMAFAVYIAAPERRRALRRIGVVALIASAVYLPAFWSKEGTVAQPARAIRSEISPTPRDEMSNQYRYIEDANLKMNIQQRKSTGSGFGLPIEYFIPITELKAQNSFIAYVPHNSVLYIWMRMGIIGGILFWLVVAEALRAACALVRSTVREASLLGALVGAALVGYVLMGEKDLGFFWFRIAVAVGVLAGAVEGVSRVAGRGRVPRGMPSPRQAEVGALLPKASSGVGA